MSERYQLVLGYSGVKRLSDGKLIPVDRDNADWAAFRRWWMSGGVCEPADDGWFEDERPRA